ncbi:MAG: carboxypeptidase-like regulatory domain-containing protein [Planctomycetota bacterium]|nr:carboxypeptidase-like regulatory domain-containing protein [Planctomycetota bacterium]
MKSKVLTTSGIAALLAVSLSIGLMFLLETDPGAVVQDGEPLERPEPTSSRENAPASAGLASEAPAGPETRAVESPPPGEEPVAATATARLMRDRYLLAGRIVEGSENAVSGGTALPVEGVTVHFKPHPRRADPKRAPPPQRTVTGPDGTFAFGRIPWGMWLRLEIDPPERGMRTLSFNLRDPEGEGRIDLGDIPVEKGLDLVFDVVGPDDEPVVGAKVMVKRTIEPRLQAIGMYESHREAAGIGGGRYRLERMAPGTLQVQVAAAGYSRFREHVAVPEDGLIRVELRPGQVIRGIVTTLDGEPVAGAELQIKGPKLILPYPTTRSDPRGRFKLDLLSAGEYRIRVRLEGYVELTKRNLRPGGDPVMFQLEPESIYSGRVFAGHGGPPLKGARVWLSRPGSRIDTVSDDEGRFTARGLVAGDYFVTVDHESYAPLFGGSIEIGPEERVEGVEIHLEPGLTASGRVTDAATAAGVPGAWVTLAPLEVPEGARRFKRLAKTGEDGTYSIVGLPEGSYTATVKVAGYIGGEPHTVAVGEKGSEGLDIVLNAGSSISGTVTDAEGQPIFGASVFLSLSSTGGAASRASGTASRRMAVAAGGPGSVSVPPPRAHKLSAQTDADGSYRLEAVPPWGGYMVTVTHRNYAFSRIDGLALGLNESIDGVDFVLSRGGSIQGRVTDEDGAGIAGVEVRYTAEHTTEEGRQLLLSLLPDRSYTGNDSTERFITRGDGSFTIARLPEGSYTLTAQVEGRLPATEGGIQVRESRSTRRVELVLPRGEVLGGRVVDPGGKPLSGAIVSTSRSLPGFPGAALRAATDDDGRFEFRGLPQRRTLFTVKKPGFAGVTSSADLPADGELLITLEPAGRVSGLVLSPVDVDYNSVHVHALGLDGGTRSRLEAVRTDTGGEFSIELPSGSYRLVATASGLAPGRSRAFAISAGAELSGIDISLGAGGRLEGAVVSGGFGTPIDGARLTIEPADGSRWTSSAARSGKSGEFLFERLAEGSYQLVADHPGHARAVLDVHVASGENPFLQVPLPPGATVRGRVLRAGAPVEGLVVFAAVEGQSVEGRARTDAEGRFVLRGIEPGRGSLVLLEERARLRSSLERSRVGSSHELATLLFDMEVAGRRVGGSEKLQFRNGESVEVEIDVRP